MKRVNVYFMMASILLAGASALAEGHAEGNGGMAMVCRNADGTVGRAELMDLFEASEIIGEPVLRNPDRGVDEQLEDAFSKLSFDRGAQQDVQDHVSDVRRRVVFIRRTMRLTPVGDDLPTQVPEGCAYEVVINYLRNGSVRGDLNIFEKLSTTDQAALWVHEAVYRRARALNPEGSAHSSRLVRPVVAGLFSSSVNAAELRRRLNLAWRNDYLRGEADIVRMNPRSNERIEYVLRSSGDRNNCRIDIYDEDMIHRGTTHFRPHFARFWGIEGMSGQNGVVVVPLGNNPSALVRTVIRAQCLKSPRRDPMISLQVRQGATVLWDFGLETLPPRQGWITNTRSVILRTTQQ